MQETTDKKVKRLSDLEDVSFLQKNKMSELFGGSETSHADKKRRGFISRLLEMRPCDGDLPQ